MKKIFTFVAIILLGTVGMTAADKFYALSEMTVVGNTYTSATFDGEKAKGNNVYVELPAATVSGKICFVGQSDKADRFLYIYGTAGTVKDETRPMTMLAAGDTIDYTSADVIIKDEKPYLLFSTGDDFKFTKFVYTAEGVAPVTAPVATVTVSGPTEAYVGEKVTLKATFDVTPDTIWWTDKFGVSLDCNKASLDFTPAAEGSFTFVAWAQNQYNVSPAASEVHTIAATVKPAAVACTNLIPAASGDALNVGDEVALNAMSEGGKIFVAGMKTAGSSIAYNALGLQLGGGGADSIRVELNNLIQEGTEITLNMVAGGTSARGLNICALDKSKLYEAKWTPSATGEENSITYIVPAGSKLIGGNKFLLQRNNSVYLASVVVANCGESTGGGEVDTDPVLAVNPESVTLNVTAAVPAPSAKVTFSGKNLAAGTYNLSVPDLAGLTVSPASVTVGEDGKLNAEVTISYTSAVEVAAASTSVDLTIGALTKVVVVNYSATLTKKYMQSINIEQLVLDNGTNYDIRAAFDAANIEYNNIDALDTLNDLENKTNRNYAFLGLKMKKTDAKLAGWLKAGQTIKVRFGNVGANFKISAMGMDSTCTAENFANTSVESNKVLEFTAPIDMYLEIVCNSTKTLVIKQIMINQEIAPVVLPAPSAYLITIQAGEHGTVTATWENKQYRTPVGALVTLTPQPDEGYKTVSLTWNGTPLYDDHVGYVTFTMPAEDVTVVAQFDTDFPTDVESIQSTEINVKKRIVNGVLYIEKNGTLYNAQGGIVK